MQLQNQPGIYKIISPTGNVYIGQAKNIYKRIQKYKWASITMNQPIIYRSITKYGWENHNVEIIEYCKINELDNKEIYYKQQFIDEFGWDKALFCRIHDAINGGNMEPWVRKKISEAKKGFKPSKESIERKRQSLIRGKQCKPAYQYDLDGNFIKKWDYREDAEVFYNGNNNSNNISQCIMGKSKSAYGFQWTSFYTDKILSYRPHLNPIKQYNLNGEFIKEWYNISEAEKTYNPEAFIKNKYGSNNIRACCNGKQKTAFGYIWKYV